MGSGQHVGMKFSVKVVQTGVRGSGVWEALRDYILPVLREKNPPQQNTVLQWHMAVKYILKTITQPCFCGHASDQVFVEGFYQGHVLGNTSFQK